MSQEYLICSKQELVDIADAVRAKTGSTDTFVVGELPQAISEIETGGGGGIAMPELCTVTFEYVYTGGALGFGGVDFVEADVEMEYVGLDDSGNLARVYATGPDSIQCIGGIYMCVVSNAPNGVNVDIQVKDMDGNDDSNSVYWLCVGEESYGMIYNNCHIIVSYAVYG
jgi:hypothetical protein